VIEQKDVNRKTEDANCKEQRFIPHRAFWNGRRFSLPDIPVSKEAGSRFG